MFQSYWPSLGIEYVILKLKIDIIYIYIILNFKIMCLMPEDGQYVWNM
jgi:hypothetical protein